jgi:hypothetical protein
MAIYRIEKLNQMIPAFLLKSNYKVFRHFLVQMVVLLITVNIFL